MILCEGPCALAHKMHASNVDLRRDIFDLLVQIVVNWLQAVPETQGTNAISYFKRIQDEPGTWV